MEIEVNGVTSTVTRLMMDKDGFPYVLVTIEGLRARHYPRAHGVPPTINPETDKGSDACIFLEGEPCWIV